MERQTRLQSSLSAASREKLLFARPKKSHRESGLVNKSHLKSANQQDAVQTDRQRILSHLVAMGQIEELQ